MDSQQLAGDARQRIQHIIDELNRQSGAPRGYLLRRIILAGYWFYHGTQVFHIPHGRMVCAGENESGKTTVEVTVNSIALAGLYRQEHLDPGGKRGKSIEYYVLPTPEGSSRPLYRERTSYVAAEFEWNDPEHAPIAHDARRRWLSGDREQGRFFTVGVCLHGSMHVGYSIESKYFLLTDGKRLIDDFPLVVDGEQGRQLQSRAHFLQWMKAHGHVYSSKTLFQKEVATQLFGFEDVEYFHVLITLLFQLRAPQLDQTIKLETVMDFLTSSLPVLPIKETQRFIDTTTHIDDHRKRTLSLQEHIRSCRLLGDLQYQAVLSAIKQVAFAYEEAEQVVNDAQTLAERLQWERDEKQRQLRDAEAKEEELAAALEEAQGALEALSEQETEHTSPLEQVEGEVQQWETIVTQAQGLRRAKQESYETVRETLQQREEEYQEHLERALKVLQRLVADASGVVQWPEAELQLREVMERARFIAIRDPLASRSLKRLLSEMALPIEEHRSWLSNLEHLQQRRRQCERDLEADQERERKAQQEVDAQQQSFATLLERVEASLADLEGMLENALSNLQAPLPALPFLAGSAQEPSHPGEPPLPWDREGVARACRHFTCLKEFLPILSGELQRQKEACEVRQGQLQRDALAEEMCVEELRRRCERLQANQEYAPDLPWYRCQARQMLKGEGIEAYPLYALLAFVPTLPHEGKETSLLEHVFADIGILDALVVLPAQQQAATTLLEREGLREALLQLPPELAVPPSPGWLGSFLCFDAEWDGEEQRAWETCVGYLLARLSRALWLKTAPGGAPLDGGGGKGVMWHYGVLWGHAVPGDGARCLGRAARRATGKRLLQEAQEMLGGAQRQYDERTALYRQGQYAKESLENSAMAVHQQQQSRMIETLLTELQREEQDLSACWTRYEICRKTTRQCRQDSQEVLAQLEAESRGNRTLQEDEHTIQEALEALRSWEGSLQQISVYIEDQQLAHARYQERAPQLSQEQGELQEHRERCRSHEATLRQQQAKLARLREQSTREEAQVQRQKQQVKAHCEELRRAYRMAHDASIALHSDQGHAEASCQAADASRREKEKTCQQQFLQLEQLLALSPGELFPHILQLLKAGETRKGLQALFETPAAFATAMSNREQLERERQEIFQEFDRACFEHARHLDMYGMDFTYHHEVLRIIIFRSLDCNVFGLLEHLERELHEQQRILNERELYLFEHFFIEGTAETLRATIARANEWVTWMNRALARMVLGGRYFELQWKPLAGYQTTKMGGLLAQHVNLLTLGPRLINEHQKQQLFVAFQQEVHRLLDTTASEKRVPYEELVQTIFDYREWFMFELRVRHEDGSSEPVTQGYVNTRSEGGKFFSLGIPLFAALSALYDRAAPGAPRLCFLDEAFRVADQQNTKTIVEFLADHSFQWIMTGAQLSLAKTRVPAYIRYWFKSDKKLAVATAIPCIWRYGRRVGILTDVENGGEQT